MTGGRNNPYLFLSASIHKTSSSHNIFKFHSRRSLKDLAMSRYNNVADEDSMEEVEVLYHDGATPLFLAVEETDWRTALDIAEANPNQVRTWVRSTGTENTTFEWSMWRRLPIHEACRRQAPAWLVSSLLSAFPDSAYKTTQFGELPLHLAVESGADPEVVNLIIVANWNAIVAQDQSGRIPTEILDTSELLQLDDHRIVHESLTRCYKAYTRMQELAQEERSLLKKKHKAEFNALIQRHQKEIKKEQDIQEAIRDDVRALESRIEDMKEVENAKDHAIKKFNREKDMWLDQIQSLGEMIESLQRALDDEKKKVSILMNTIKEKDEEIYSRDERIELLSTDLRNVAVMHDDKIMESLIQTEKSMRAMVSNQIALQKNLAGQSNGLKALLNARGIPLPEPEIVENDLEGEEMKTHQEETLDASEAASAVMAAARAALQKPPILPV